jgi:hypothetical protein
MIDFLAMGDSKRELNHTAIACGLTAIGAEARPNWQERPELDTLPESTGANHA